MATTTHRLVFACSALLLSPAWLGAQVDTPSKALQRAIVIEEQERDLEQAAKAYRVVLSDAQAGADARGEAAVRLGRVLQRLGRADEAREVLAEAARGGAPKWARQAGALLQSASKDVEAIRAKAREVLSIGTGSYIEQLLQLGPESVPEILAAETGAWRAGRGTRLTSAMWILGGSAARGYIGSVISRGDPAEHRVLLSAMPRDLARDMREVALDLLGSPAAPGEARVTALDAMGQQAPIEMLIQLAKDAEPSVSTEAWAAIGRYLAALRGERQAPVLAKCLPAFRAKLASLDLADVKAARQVLARYGVHLHATRELILETLPSWPKSASAFVDAWKARPDEHYDGVLSAARSMGRPRPNDQRIGFVASVVASALRAWSKDKLPGVVELIKLGYTPDWLGWAKRHEFGPEVLLRALDGDVGVTRLLGLFDPERLPADVLGSLTRSWSGLGRTSRARMAMPFASWVALTGHEQAGEWIERMAAGADEQEMAVATHGLVKLLEVDDRPDTRERMRRRVLNDESSDRSFRNYLFSELVKKGDSVACGWIASGKATAMDLGVAWAIELLSTELLERESSPLSMDQLSAAWRAGLGRESEDHLTAAGRWLLAHHERSDHSLWHKLADLSVAAATRIAGGAKVSRAQDSNVNRLATAVFAATGAQQPISQRLEVLMTAMMESSSKELRVRVLNFLGARATIGADWRQRILRLANSTGLASERARAVLEFSLRLTVDEL